jgi:hypothetical protein
MNDDDYWNILSGSTSTTRELYDLLKNYQNYKDYNRKGDMAYSYSRGYYKDTRGDEVATAVLEAYAKGIEFDALLTKNKQVRTYWNQIQSEKIRAEQMREKERQRQAKLAERRAIEQAQKEEVMAKLSKEELEAFGLINKKRASKR